MIQYAFSPKDYAMLRGKLGVLMATWAFSFATATMNYAKEWLAIVSLLVGIVAGLFAIKLSKTGIEARKVEKRTAMINECNFLKNGYCYGAENPPDECPFKDTHRPAFCVFSKNNATTRDSD